MAENLTLNIDDDGVALIVIDMPGRSMNVFNEALIAEFEAAVEQVLTDDAIKGAVITSGKPAFLAGADLSMLQGLSQLARTAEPEALLEAVGLMARILRRMESGGKPFAAAVGGLAMGGGLELALACHHRLVADDKKIQLGLPEVKVGMVPGAGGTQRLPRLMGIQAALPYLLEGKSMSPAEAVSFGVFHKAVPRAGLIEEARARVLADRKPAQPWDGRGFKIPGGKVMSPAVFQTFVAGNAMLRAKTYGNYPAADAIMSAVYEGLQLPIDGGLMVEARYVSNILRGPVVGNMIRTLFVNKGAADKLIRRPRGIEKNDIRTLGILGAGMMGAGIAYVSAVAGMDVVLLDRDIESVNRGRDHAAGLLDKQGRRRKTSREAADETLARIRPTVDYTDLAACDLVIEAVFEDPDIKAGVTRQTEAVIGKAAIFASNTSSLPISGLAEASVRPESFIGIHFFSPVHRMPLVEIIRGEKTGDKALAMALDYVRAIRKTPIVVNDSPGFFTSRVFGTYVNEGLAMLAEGVPPALIENIGKMAGMPVGPLAVADEVSLDLAHHIKELAKKAYGDSFSLRHCEPVIDRMVLDLKRLGKKAGKGFYDYPEGGKKRLWPGLAEQFPLAASLPPADDLRQRFLFVQAIETARCMEEGVIGEAADADVGAIMGWGFAPFTGGPLSMIDTIGAAKFVGLADGLAERFGERFVAPDGLRQMAKKGGLYYPLAA